MRKAELERLEKEAKDALSRFNQQNELLQSRLAKRAEALERLVQAVKLYEETEGVKVELSVSERKAVKPVGSIEVVK